MSFTRLAVAALLTLFSTVAFAQSVKQVEVTNFPEVQDVHVTNPTTPANGHVQLVGFTAASYDGDMGGHFGVT